jgi:transposase-like protein
MDELLQAGRYERNGQRQGYRSGSYPRTLMTRVGKLELRVPQDRDGKFSTEIFQRYARSEQALVSTLAQMYIQGVSTRNVKQITEELCGQEVSAATVSRINKTLDEQLNAFAHRQLTEEFPYLIVDARYERVRTDGVIRSQAVQLALGINWDGRRQVLAVELANRESEGSWQQLLEGMKQRGLRGVEYVVSDAHEGLRNSISKTLPQAVWQRCYVHFLRNALDHLPRKADPDCMQELRWLYDRRDVEEARAHLAAWLLKWEGRYARLCEWVEQNIEETWSFYRQPQQHHKHLKSTNMLERFNQELKRRTNVVRIFPNEESCLRLVRALAVETHEEWLEGTRYLNMEYLKESKKEALHKNEKAA